MLNAKQILEGKIMVEQGGMQSSDLRVTQLVTEMGSTLPFTFHNFVGLSRAH